jgi:hypothetical protein
VSPFPNKVCGLCGARALPGTVRCAAHAQDSGRPGTCEVCGHRTEHGARCPLHPVTEAERRRRFPYREHYSSVAYRRNRPLRYLYDQGTCQRCHKPVPADNYRCDHHVAVLDGGSDEIENLRTMHHGCHNVKTTADRRRRKAEREDR